MPKVSIIMPVYNSEKYLSDAIESVLRQSFEDWELVCVDDGSTDGSATILEKFQRQDGRVRVIHQENAGGSAARNTGLNNATGEFVMFLDSDDLYARDLISQAYERATQKGVDVVFYGFARFVSKPTWFVLKNRLAPDVHLDTFTKDSYAERFFNDFGIITWNKLVKRAVIEKSALRFDTELSHNHDVDFAIRLMLAAESFSWLDVTGYYYRDNDTGITATKRSDPTNVLKILSTLGGVVDETAPQLSSSFRRYVADMIAGTFLKYESDTEKRREVFSFAREVTVPRLGMGGDIDESTGIYKALADGDLKSAEVLLSSPSRRIKGLLRKAHELLQRISPRTPV